MTTAAQLRTRLSRLAAQCPRPEIPRIVFVAVEPVYDAGGRVLPPRVVGKWRSTPGVDPRDDMEEIPLG